MGEVRAGAFLQNESLQNLEDLIKSYGHSLRLLVKAEPSDTTDPAKLLSAMKIMGQNRILTQFPDFLETEMHEIPMRGNNNHQSHGVSQPAIGGQTGSASSNNLSPKSASQIVVKTWAFYALF